MYRDALLGRKATKPQAAAPVAPAPAAAAAQAPPQPQASSSSSSKRDGSSTSRGSQRDNSWKTVKPNQPVSHWSGYAFVEDNGIVCFNSKHFKNEKVRHIRPQNLILNFHQSGSPVPHVSCRLMLEVKRPAQEASSENTRRPTLPMAVPVKTPSMQFALDAVLQCSRNQKTPGNLFSFAREDGTPFDKDTEFTEANSPVKVKINFDCDETRSEAVLDKMRYGDRLAREAEDLSSLPAPPKEKEPRGKDQLSPKRQKQNQAIRWYFVALLCTAPFHAEEGGLVPLLCNRLAALWSKMKCHHTSLFWAEEALKVAPEDFHGHLNRCQALLDLGRFDQAAAAATEALERLEGSCTPIRRILSSARAQNVSSVVKSSTSKSWKLCDDVTGLILDMLTSTDRMNAAIVCKHWGYVVGHVVSRRLMVEKPSKVLAFQRLAASTAISLGSMAKYLFRSTNDRWFSGYKEQFVFSALKAMDAGKLRWALLSWSGISESNLSDEGTQRSLLGCCVERYFAEETKAEDRPRVLELLKTALRHGCDANQRLTPRRVEWTDNGTLVHKGVLPLEYAISKNSSELIRVLVEHGAEPERLLKGIGKDKRLSSLEQLLLFYPKLLEHKPAALQLVSDCVESGWLEGLKVCHRAGIFARYPSIVDGLIESSLKRLSTLTEAGVSDALWVEPDKLPFTKEALQMLMSCRNAQGAGLPSSCEAMKIAKDLDEALWTAGLQKMLSGAPHRAPFSLYSVNNYKVAV